MNYFYLRVSPGFFVNYIGDEKTYNCIIRNIDADKILAIDCCSGSLVKLSYHKFSKNPATIIAPILANYEKVSKYIFNRKSLFDIFNSLSFNKFSEIRRYVNPYIFGKRAAFLFKIKYKIRQDIKNVCYKGYISKSILVEKKYMELPVYDEKSLFGVIGSYFDENENYVNQIDNNFYINNTDVESSIEIESTDIIEVKRKSIEIFKNCFNIHFIMPGDTVVDYVNSKVLVVKETITPISSPWDKIIKFEGDDCGVFFAKNYYLDSIGVNNSLDSDYFINVNSFEISNKFKSFFLSKDKKIIFGSYFESFNIICKKIDIEIV